MARLNLHISVVIPTKDRCSLIKDALAGLANQTLPADKFEVIIVDNGSSDNTVEFLYQNRDNYPFNLHILETQEDKGPAPARNLGVKYAIGEIIAFLDSDCRPAENWLEIAHKTFNEYKDLSFASGVVDFKPEQVDKISFFSRKTVIALTEHPTYPTTNSFYKKNIFHQFGGFDESMSFPNIFGQAVEAADTDLAWRVLDAQEQYTFMAEAIVYHEVQVLPLIDWLMEPFRLFLLPLLIRNHPQLRKKLLHFNLFFFQKSILYYLLAFLFVFSLFTKPSILLFVPIPLCILAIIKEKAINPYKVFMAIIKLLLNAARNYIMCTALIYGSIKYRTLVL